MSAQHTPGPWVAAENGSAVWDVDTGDRIATVFPARLRAEYTGCIGPSDPVRTKRVQRAFLIATAPDLLAELGNAVEYIETLTRYTDHWDIYGSEISGRIRALIAKARGEA